MLKEAWLKGPQGLSGSSPSAVPVPVPYFMWKVLTILVLLTLVKPMAHHLASSVKAILILVKPVLLNAHNGLSMLLLLVKDMLVPVKVSISSSILINETLRNFGLGLNYFIQQLMTS